RCGRALGGWLCAGTHPSARQSRSSSLAGMFVWCDRDRLIPAAGKVPEKQISYLHHRSKAPRCLREGSVGPFNYSPKSAAAHHGAPIYLGLIAVDISLRFFCQASYSRVPARGGTSLGIPPSHAGTLSATTALTAVRGSVA